MFKLSKNSMKSQTNLGSGLLVPLPLCVHVSTIQSYKACVLLHPRCLERAHTTNEVMPWLCPIPHEEMADAQRVESYP